MDGKGTTPSPCKWQYTWEALSQLRTLRLYLFQHYLSPLAHYHNLTASLCTPHAHFNGVSLLIKWTNEPIGHSSHSRWAYVRVPVPHVALDHSIPVEYRAMCDHIEVKLRLMLEVDHPLVGSLFSLLGCSDASLNVQEAEEEQNQQQFSLDKDTKALANQGEVDLYCKNCSMQLTKEPIRFFKELPSADWRDVADNWFGTCCCSFGGISQSLVSNFENFSIISTGTCFVGPASITVLRDDLARDAITEHDIKIVTNIDENPKLSENKNEIEIKMSNPEVPVQYKLKDKILVQTHKHINKNGTLPDLTESAEKLRDQEANIRNSCNGVSVSLLERTKTEEAHFSYNQELETMCSEESESGIPVSDFSKSTCNSANLLASAADSTLQSVDEQFYRSPKFQDPAENCNEHSSSTVSRAMTSSYNGIPTSLYCCCSDDSKNALLEETNNICISDSNYERKRTFSFYVGSGFMMRSAGVSNSVEWVAVLCSSCLSLIGSYPDFKGKPSSNSEIIQLFKCHLSTSKEVDGLHDVFRRHTLQRVFANQLQVNAEDELSYRTVVRDLKTKVPMLQMVLVNTNVWVCCADCPEKFMEGEESASSLESFENDFKGTGVTTAGAANGYDCPKLEPVVKVLFRDCSSCSPDESRAINEWAVQKHAEDIFMLEEEIKALREALMAVNMRLPESCSSLEGFYLAFLDR